MDAALDEHQLLTAAEVARLISYQPNSLRRKNVRARLEAQGFPPPVAVHRLRWLRRDVLRWIDPAAALAARKQADIEAKRRALAAAYGEGMGL